MSRDENTDDDTSETTDTQTLAERITERYPAHNWEVIDDDTLRLEAGDAYIEVAAYSFQTEGDGDESGNEIRCDMEINHPRGCEVTLDEVSLDDLPGAIGQGLAVLHALDLATTGESFNVDADAVPGWAVAAFVEQAGEVSNGMDDLSYLKTYDADRYARRYVLAEHVRQRQKWPAEHDDEHDEPMPALASAAWWLILPTAVSEPVPARVPTWAIELKNQISEQWPDVTAAHEIGCIKAAALLLAEIARCRRVRQKAEQAERAAKTTTPAQTTSEP